MAPLIVVAVAFIIGIFAARRERMDRLARGNGEGQTGRHAIR
jgi:hypothetical protein